MKCGNCEYCKSSLSDLSYYCGLNNRTISSALSASAAMFLEIPDWCPINDPEPVKVPTVGTEVYAVARYDIVEPGGMRAATYHDMKLFHWDREHPIEHHIDEIKLLFSDDPKAVQLRWLFIDGVPHEVGNKPSVAKVNFE